jgi:hypothetical protein
LSAHATASIHTHACACTCACAAATTTLQVPSTATVVGAERTVSVTTAIISGHHRYCLEKPIDMEHTITPSEH